MTNCTETIEFCRICKSGSMTDVIDLGEQYITSRFPVYGDWSTPKTQITLCLCHECGLLQLRQTTFASELYEYEYGYRSGISNTMREHLLGYQKEIVSIANPSDGDIIIDIGSNDATMLNYYPNTLRKIGIDPTGSQFKEYYGVVELVPTYFTKEAYLKNIGNKKARVVSSISMFYDLPDPVKFAKDIYDVLEDDGIWTCEQSYVLSMIKSNSVDTICHEHLEYYGLSQIKLIADMAGFKIIKVVFNECNGGSFRVYFAKNTNMTYQEAVDDIKMIIDEENKYGIGTVECYRKFVESCRKEIDSLTMLVDTINNNGQKIWIYGASTKGNCLLQCGNLNENRLKYAVERNLNKIGKMTSLGSLIIGEDDMRKNAPEYLLVLPWHFKEEIVKRENDYLMAGGKLVFPFPQLTIVSYKKKLLITGCEGHIGYYVKTMMNEEYELYGICREMRSQENSIMKFVCDVNDRNKMENIIMAIKPDIILHLAGISNVQKAHENPVNTIMNNGMSTVYLCEIIKNNKLNAKLINISSSEMFKGHKNYTVLENDHHMYNQHPYAISKMLGHNMIEYYRTTYNLMFSNIILFMTESKHKGDNFLLNKIANHAKKYLEDGKEITVGNLDSYRNISHTSDLVRGIEIICKQNYGDTYVLCNKYNVKISELVIEIYKRYGIDIMEYNTETYYMLMDKKNNKIVLKIDDSIRSDDRKTNINGYCTKLYQLGWEPKYGIKEIIDDIVGTN